MTLSTESAGESASGITGAYIRLHNDNGVSDSSDYNSLNHIVGDGESDQWIVSGTLSASIELQDGNTGSFDAWVDIEAEAISEESTPVPEPSSLALLFIGLMSSIGLMRRKR